MPIKISPGLLRRIHMGAGTLTSCNTFLIVASYSFGPSGSSFSRWATSNHLLLPQVLVNLFALFYCYFKGFLGRRWLLQLCMSMFLAVIYLVFAATVFPKIMGDSSDFLLQIVEGVNVVVAALLMVDAVLTVIWVRNENKSMEDSEIGEEERRLRSGAGSGEEVQRPQQVHVYQPLISLAPLSARRGSVLSVAESGRSSPTTAQQQQQQQRQGLSTDDTFHISIPEARATNPIEEDEDERLELEELPKYQRKPPAQSATIIDLANLEGVDPAVLNSIPLLQETQAQAQAQAQPQPQAHGQRGEHVAEAPVYSLATPASASAPAPASSAVPEPAHALTLEPPVYMP